MLAASSKAQTGGEQSLPSIAGQISTRLTPLYSASPAYTPTLLFTKFGVRPVVRQAPSAGRVDLGRPIAMAGSAIPCPFPRPFAGPCLFRHRHHLIAGEIAPALLFQNWNCGRAQALRHRIFPSARR